MLKLTSRKAGLAVAASIGLAVSLTTAGAASAAVRPADSAGNFELCSGGNYSSYASFPGRGGWSTNVVPVGYCYVYNIGGNVNETVNVYLYNGTSYYLGSTIYNGLLGETIVTTATSFYVE